MAKKTTLSYSDAIAELETIVNKLQNNEYEIDELQKCTTRSLELLKFCKSKLFETDEALQKILAELTRKTENIKFTGKGLTKQIFPDILIKVGLKSHEKSEKTR